ncbi:hypothetical protein BHE74_00013809 [Ensete ventricosum]|nr:hypothetical protein BHE74_00013809 [Ensete ventricosum]RZR87733.1 hypothetical protein BHM03_00015199 [Ensete ventricosum]
MTMVRRASTALGRGWGKRKAAVALGVGCGRGLGAADVAEGDDDSNDRGSKVRLERLSRRKQHREGVEEIGEGVATKQRRQWGSNGSRGGERWGGEEEGTLVTEEGATEEEVAMAVARAAAGEVGCGCERGEEGEDATVVVVKEREMMDSDWEEKRL